MNNETKHTDEKFLAQQKKQLLAMQHELQTSLRGEEGDERSLQSQNSGGAREAEDDAQKLDRLEVDGLLASHSAQRLASINDALQKIENGTYGVSVVSGKIIPRARLEAMPDATCTVEEEKAREAKS